MPYLDDSSNAVTYPSTYRSYLLGLFLVDDEGTLSTTDVKARFVNGKPQAIEARYNMRSQFEWDRFIRFMDR